MISIFRHAIFAGVALTGLPVVSPSAAAAVSADDLREIRELFLRQAAGETAHDIDVIESVLARTPAGQPDPVNFVARAYTFWGFARKENAS